MTLSRADAYALMTEYTQSESLRKHMLAVEAAVRGYARMWGEPEEEWAVVALHIIGWRLVQKFFRGVGRVLRADGLLLVYGPFRYGGQYTSHSNHAFDDALRRRDPASGIRDFEAVDALAVAQGLTLVDDVAMPANNQTLVWRKTG